MSDTDMSVKSQAFPVPAEVLLQIFALLPSLSDVLSLATTCRRLHGVWIDNVNTIYSSIAPKTILCHDYARRLLADLDGPPLGSPLAFPDDVRSILHTSRVIEKAILQFEREVVPLVQCTYFSLREYYGSSRHVPFLTPGEKRRFAKGYYLVLSLVHQPAKFQSETLQTLTLKSLYILHEMSKLNQYLPGEEVDPSLTEDSRIWGYHGGEKRIQLHRVIDAELKHKYERVWEREEIRPWAYGHKEGALWFMAVWTHWQETLKEICCHPVGTSKEKRKSVDKGEVWDDSESEDESM